MASSIRGQGTCPVCGGEFAIDDAGTVWEHRAKIEGKRQRCPGSGQRTGLPPSIAADRLDGVLSEVAAEYVAARERFAPMHSGHEGYAVILEELDELEAAIAELEGELGAAERVAPMRHAVGVIWADVKGNRPGSMAARMEAIQVAAMAISYIIEVCDDD